jgi:hypothetical protein
MVGAISRQHVARPAWPAATHKGKLTARRLVITFVPTHRAKIRTVPEESKGGPINYSDAGRGDFVAQLGQLAAFIQQRILYVYRRQRSTPLPSRTAKSRTSRRLCGR